MDQHYLYLAFVLFLRLFFMVGLALGDDPAYNENDQMILKGHCHLLCKFYLFSFRPILLFPTAFSIKLFGCPEFNLTSRQILL